jgi:cytochrome c-type biogenesis protein
VTARFSVAFLAGMLSFLSPCVLPLVPSYLTAASALGGRDRTATTSRTLAAGVPFVAGFTTIFVTFGAGAGVIGGKLPLDYAGLHALSGFVLVVFGLAFAGALPWHRLIFAPAVAGLAHRRHSAVLLGAAFATCAAPCAGPILGATLVLAGSTRSAGAGAVSLLGYSLGLALPFVATGIAFTHLLRPFRWLGKRLVTLQLAGGALLVATGMLVFFDRIWWLNVVAHRLQEAISTV